MNQPDVQAGKRGRLFPLLIFAITVSTAWLSALLWMTLSFSNPVTLNPVQILESDSILLGEFQGRDFVVSKTWKVDPQQEKLRLRNLMLASIEPEPETDYLIPVMIKTDHFEITPSRVRGIPLIYPASEKVFNDLEATLSE